MMASNNQNCVHVSVVSKSSSHRRSLKRKPMLASGSERWEQFWRCKYVTLDCTNLAGAPEKYLEGLYVPVDFSMTANCISHKIYPLS